VGIKEVQHLCILNGIPEFSGKRRQTSGFIILSRGTLTLQSENQKHFHWEKNNGDKLLCTLLAVMCGAKVTDDTAAYALRTPSQTGDMRLAKTATW